MLDRRGSADVNPSSISLIALKPRQILLAERQKKNTTRHNPMAKNETENKAQLKPEQKSLLFYSFALCLQNQGFSKTLKRFISEAQIKDDDWEARALNLEDIFSKYLKTCNEVYTNVDVRKDQERQADGTWEENGFNNSAASKGNVRKKKKNYKNDTDFAAMGVGKTSQEVQTQDKFIESNVKSKTEKNKRADDTLVQSDHELLTSKQVTDGEVPVDEFTRKQKEKNIKKSKSTSELFDGDEMPKLTEEKSKDLNDSKDDSVALVESKDEKKRKKVKKDCLFEDGEKGSLKNISKVNADNVVSDILLEEDKVQGKEKKRRKESTEKSVETVEDGANEYVASKKRKRLAHDEDGKQTVEDIAVESKHRKTDEQEEVKGAEQQVNGSLNGVEKSSQSKSTRKQINSYHEPKTVNAFQRVKVDEVKFVDERLQDNSYWAKDGADTGYGAKAQEILGQVRGRDFRHEKTKKKRGSYRGGQIDLQSHSIKFNYSGEE